MLTRHVFGALAGLAFAASAGAQGWIAFTGARPGECGTYAAPASGGAAQTLFKSDGVLYGCAYGYAIWQPNGRRVTFKADLFDGVHYRQVWAVDAPDGGPMVRLTDTAAFDAVSRGWSYSRDGARIAIAGDRENPVYRLGLFSMPAGGGTPTLLVPAVRTVDTEMNPTSPVFSPDGSRIAYLRVTFGPASYDIGLDLVPAAGGAPQTLVASGIGEAGGTDLDWAPSGTFLAALAGSAAFDVVRVDVATGTMTNLSNGAFGSCKAPRVSPDSTRIAAICGTDLVVFLADGSGASVLTTDAVGYNASWAPDGTALAYAYLAPTGQGVARVGLDGIVKYVTDPVYSYVDGVGYQPATAQPTSLRVDTASYSYRSDALSLVVYSSRGAADQVSVVGVGPLTYSASRWRGTFNLALAPADILICGVDGCLTP